MNILTLASRHLPGSRGFIRRSPRFRHPAIGNASSASELVDAVADALRTGRLQGGDAFPNPDRRSQLSGAPLVESLDAVTSLLRSGLIRQDPSGRLSVTSASDR